MSNQSIIIAIVIVIIVAVVSGYIIHQGLNEEEEIIQEDGIYSLFSGLKEYTGLEFSNEEDIEFSWMIEKEGGIKEMIANGKQVEAKEVTNLSIISRYFKDNGFKEDIYNVASGTVVGLVGYKKDNIICIVVEKIRADNSSPEEEINSDVSVKCGYFNELSDGLSGGEIIDKGIKNIKKNDEFVISLEANLTTGYQWNVDFDNYYIELIDVSYDPESSGLIGAGSVEVFKFKALQEGEVDLNFLYLRPWEEKAPIKKVSYKIIIE